MFAREKQYGDFIEKLMKQKEIDYKREYQVEGTGNRVDFFVENKIILELKTKKFLSRDDYYQVQRYLQTFDVKLGILVNFRSKSIRPKRIIRIDTPNRVNYNGF